MMRLLAVSLCVGASIYGATLVTDGLSARCAEMQQADLTPVRHGVTHAPRIRESADVDESTSSNWSGYAELTSLTSLATGVVSEVHGSWTVPAVTGAAKGKTTYSSLWVGIDGYADGTVEQLGTEQDWSHGSAQYYAWYEMYPSASHYITNVSVHPGDSITASVNYDGTNFNLSLTNNTTHETFSISQAGSGFDRSSAEWIAEAPSIGSVLPLANFGTASFSNCGATISGNSVAIDTLEEDQMTMGTRKVTKAVTSALSAGGTAFHVDWKHE
jgi:hypothetical protein